MIAAFIIEREDAGRSGALDMVRPFCRGKHIRTAARQIRIAISSAMKPLVAPKTHNQMKKMHDVTPRPSPAAREILNKK